ncbi:NAD(P)/FAD-dependent oxidoreductase [Vallicoccus soli]|uniref:NAD(P)/FAD-dependent oxidoreductase n=1 Tax=Vallicoccus soli TaxID=2339232 RepID=A0A3A3Z4Q9_9ACTN|nr:NAD(P)/FAD-dependent oxidoreductase [Vallicoccus soli]RJK97928.1 NAD(P)/FAD-dependent oxidoreductase [Vallicoccus soli]
MTKPRILIVGGGYVGMYTALRLQRKLARSEAEIVVVDPRSYMTYQPFLPEAAAGSLEPRHVVVPLRKVLPGCDVLTASVSGIDHARKTATVIPHQGDAFEVSYDHLVVALGSVARTLPIPGLAECGVGFKRVEEAIFLRNHVIDQLDIAESTDDEALRRRALTFVFVGGGYAGVEAFAELEDMARDACRYYENITPADMHWVLVEASNRILPEVGWEMGQYTLERLRERGMDVRLETLLKSTVDKHVVLSDGSEFDTNTVVWTAGVKPHPLLKETDLPVDDKGRLMATAELRVEGVEGAWTAGDCAAVPDVTKGPGNFTGPSAQHAVRQAKRLADNIVAELRGLPTQNYRHEYAGSVASLGLHKGVAAVYGVKLKGWPAWLMHRAYHLSRVPTTTRKAQVLADWTTAALFRRETVSLGSLSRPRDEFSTYAVRTQPEPALNPGKGQ